MKTLRDSKAVAVFGILAVALAFTVVAAPTAEAGCGGYGYGYGYGVAYHAPVVAPHYVAPVYPTYKYVAPVIPATYYAPTYVAPAVHVTPAVYRGW